jgi:hypothetical protein
MRKCGGCGVKVNTEDPNVERIIPNPDFPRHVVYFCKECKETREKWKGER